MRIVVLTPLVIHVILGLLHVFSISTPFHKNTSETHRIVETELESTVDDTRDV